MEFNGTPTLKLIYKPSSLAGSTGLIMTGTAAGVDCSNFRGKVIVVFSASTSSTAGATDKVEVKLQHSTSSAHGDAYADVTNGGFITNVTGSMQGIEINSSNLKRFVRIYAKATGTFVVGLSMYGSTT